MVEVHMLVLTYQQEMLCHAHVIHVSVSKASITRKAHVKFSVSSSLVITVHSVQAARSSDKIAAGALLSDVTGRRVSWLLLLLLLLLLLSGSAMPFARPASSSGVLSLLCWQNEHQLSDT